jgi:hypothetical protein
VERGSRHWRVRAGIYVGFEEHKPRAIAVGLLPTSASCLAATVALAYNEKAHKGLVVCVSKHLRVWFTECGYTYALAMNLGHTDRSFISGWRHHQV